MTKYILRRILISVPLFLAITMIVYTLYAVSPGDPLVNIIGYEAFLHMTPAELDQVREQYGLDQPVYVRYLRWLGKAVQVK